NANLWNGQIVSDDEFKKAMTSNLKHPMFWARAPLGHYVLFDVIQKIQNEKGDKTANRYLRNFKACWNWNKRKLKDNLWVDIKPYPEEKIFKYIPSGEDIKIVKSCASQWEKDFIETIIKTGARLSELLSLKWVEVNFEDGTLLLWTRKRRNGQKQSRTLPISDDLKKILNRQKEVTGQNDYVFINPITNNKYEKNHAAIKNMLKRLCKQGGVKPFGFHSLRHFISKKLMKSNLVNLSDIQNFLGHERATTTDLYLQSINPNLKHLTQILDESDNFNG
ncbi:MAG: site-specific integrase, partial [Desulfosalsimonadaceae bacterium]|nr:site-specific integrase [Desulfosalsimonadaceae bacterium]